MVGIKNKMPPNLLNTNNSGISLTAEAVDQMVSKTFPNKCFC
jgi:hypothetical protein